METYTNNTYYEPESEQQFSLIELQRLNNASYPARIESITSGDTTWYLLYFQYQPEAKYQHKENGGIQLIEGKYTQVYNIVDDDINDVKGILRSENDSKCHVARDSQRFSVTINDTELSFITDSRTQSDLQTALAMTGIGKTVDWVDEEGVSFTFETTEQVASILEKYSETVSMVYPIWAEYEAQIAEAETVAELRDIIIDYRINRH